jgi:hypothetical protein
MGTPRATTPGLLGDGGSIVVGWLTRIIVVFAVLGVLGYDGVAIIQGRVNVSDEADQIAQDAHDTWSDGHSVDRAYATARDEAAARGDSAPAAGFTIDPRTGLVTVKVVHTVQTLLVKRFGFSKGWATMTATGHAQDQS